MIALLTAKDPAYVREAAKRGVFAYIVDGDADELQSAIDITLQRFAEYQSLQGAFGRRALIEQAKGILMARHAIDADHAFAMLRDHSQHNGRKLVDVAQAIVAAATCCCRRCSSQRVPSPQRKRCRLANGPGTPGPFAVVLLGGDRRARRLRDVPAHIRSRLAVRVAEQTRLRCM